MNTQQLVNVDEIYSRSFHIKISESTETKNQTQSFVVNLNRHAKQRLLERNIGIEEVVSAIFFGYSIQKQGVTFHALSKETYVSDFRFAYKRTEGLVVICDDSSGIVLTTFRRNDPVGFIKKKPKYRRNYTSCQDVYSSSEMIPDIYSISNSIVNLKLRA
jgi:hypothetical protein